MSRPIWPLPAGNASGGAQYEYQAGPDGRRYAVGGHVNIDMTPVAGNPRATLQKAMAVRAAATAPAEPSGADLSVAAAAAQMAAQAAASCPRMPPARGTRSPAGRWRQRIRRNAGLRSAPMRRPVPGRAARSTWSPERPALRP